MFTAGQWPGTQRGLLGLLLFLLPSRTCSRSGLSLKSQASTKEPTTAANRAQSQCEAPVASHRTWDILHNQNRDADQTFDGTSVHVGHAPMVAVPKRQHRCQRQIRSFLAAHNPPLFQSEKQMHPRPQERREGHLYTNEQIKVGMSSEGTEAARGTRTDGTKHPKQRHQVTQKHARDPCKNLLMEL